MGIGGHSRRAVWVSHSESRAPPEEAELTISALPSAVNVTQETVPEGRSRDPIGLSGEASHSCTADRSSTVASTFPCGPNPIHRTGRS